jgi:hypothetical protein
VGYGIALAAGTAATVVVRAVYLIRIFPAFSILAHTARAIAPTALAAIGILAARKLGPDGTGAARALAELAGYMALVVAGTLAAERALLREAVGYLRRSPPRPSVAGG